MSIYDLYNKWCSKNYHVVEETLIYAYLLTQIDKSKLTNEGVTKYEILSNEINNILEATL